MENNLVKETTRKYLKYHFSEDERKEQASELARFVGSKNELEQQKKEAMAQFKADIEKADSQISTLSTHLNQGYIHKNIDCEVTKDFDRKTVTIIRLDTGEFVESRAMTPNELQKELFGGD